MPVFPLVASMTVDPGFNSPAFSASRIIDTAMRSLTDESGLNDSSLTTTSALPASGTRLSRTSGVLPIVSVMSLYIFPCIPDSSSENKRTRLWVRVRIQCVGDGAPMSDRVSWYSDRWRASWADHGIKLRTKNQELRARHRRRRLPQIPIPDLRHRHDHRRVAADRLLQLAPQP